MDAPIHWLLTYLLHSTVLLGAAVLVRLALGDRRLALQEAVLRAAIVGSFLTASLQIALEIRPLGGTLAVPLPATAQNEPAAPAYAELAAALPASVAVESLQMTQLDTAVAAPRPLPERPASTPAWTVVVQRFWRITLAALWSGLALIGLARVASSAVRLRRLLRGRRPLADHEVAPGMRVVAEMLGLTRRVRLSAAPRLTVPLATGVVKPEVCLPPRALAELAADERTALCAHELAHIARRDPAWLLIAHVIEAVAPLQPLNRWARRHLANLSECLSDDLAVSASAQPLGLARSLVDVASWTLGGRPACPATAAGALSVRSRLAYRVERLMDPLRHPERPHRFFLPLAGLSVLATALVTPVVSGRAAAAPEAAPAVAAPFHADAPTPPLPPDPPEAAALPEPPADAELAAPAPPAPPEPAALPAPPALPMPAAHPAPLPHPHPMPHPASAVLPHPRPQMEQELDNLSERIEERIHGREAEMEKLQAEIDAIAARIRPDDGEIERLSEELGRAAGELAELSVQHAEADKNGAGVREKRAEAERRVAELRAQVRESAARIRIPEERLRALTDKARELAEMARPNPEEMRELTRLSSQVARASAPRARELARGAVEQAREAGRHHGELAEHAREAMREAREQMRHAQEQMREAQEEMRRAEEETAQAQDQALEAQREARRLKQEADRAQAHQRSQSTGDKETEPQSDRQ